MQSNITRYLIQQRIISKPPSQRLNVIANVVLYIGSCQFRKCFGIIRAKTFINMAVHIVKRLYCHYMVVYGAVAGER